MLRAAAEAARPSADLVSRADSWGRGASDTGLFTLNGRFTTQPVSGVQRYAHEIAAALDRLLARSGQGATLLLPAGARDVPPLQAFARVETSGPAGHVWEQGVLPVQRRGPLLNLCNTAPVLGGRGQVVCLHDANVYLQPDSYSGAFRAFYKTLWPVLARTGARLATVSRFSAGQLAGLLGVPLQRFTVLPNGHEHVSGWAAERSTVLRDAPPRRPFVLLIGSRARHKNMALLLDMADALDAAGLDLFVAGGSAGIFAQTHQTRAPNLRWLGRVTDDDLAALYASALCLAFPSFTEGFGLPVVEAMALGCPVVSSDQASLPEVCGDAALLAPPTEPKAWMRHLTALAASPALRADLSGRGRHQARQFSWDMSAAGYLAMLQNTGPNSI